MDLMCMKISLFLLYYNEFKFVVVFLEFVVIVEEHKAAGQAVGPMIDL